MPEIAMDNVIWDQHTWYTAVNKVGLLLHVMIPITDYIHKLEKEVSIGY